MWNTNVDNCQSPLRGTVLGTLRASYKWRATCYKCGTCSVLDIEKQLLAQKATISFACIQLSKRGPNKFAASICARSTQRRRSTESPPPTDKMAKKYILNAFQLDESRAASGEQQLLHIVQSSCPVSVITSTWEYAGQRTPPPHSVISIESSPEYCPSDDHEELPTAYMFASESVDYVVPDQQSERNEQYIVGDIDYGVSFAHDQQSLDSMGSTSRSVSPTSSAPCSSAEDQCYVANNARQLAKAAQPRYQCADCHKSYAQKAGLVKHNKSDCIIAEEFFTCTICKRSYTRKTSLNMHIKSHSRRFTCPRCDKSYKWKQSLKSHICKYVDQKPGTCARTVGRQSKPPIRKTISKDKNTHGLRGKWMSAISMAE